MNLYLLHTALYILILFKFSIKITLVYRIIVSKKYRYKIRLFFLLDAHGGNAFLNLFTDPIIY